MKLVSVSNANLAAMNLKLDLQTSNIQLVAAAPGLCGRLPVDQFATGSGNSNGDGKSKSCTKAIVALGWSLSADGELSRKLVSLICKAAAKLANPN